MLQYLEVALGGGTRFGLMKELLKIVADYMPVVPIILFYHQKREHGSLLERRLKGR